MSYTGRHRHKTRRERYERNRRNLRTIALFALIALVILAFKNRVYIYDTVRFWFY